MRTAALWLLGVLACVGLTRAAGGFGLADGSDRGEGMIIPASNDRGEGLISPSMVDDFNGGQGGAWDDNTGLRSKKKSSGHAVRTSFAGRTGKSTAKPGTSAADRAAADDSGSSWIPGVSQPWILISAALGGLCLVLAPIWLAVRFVRVKRAPRRAGQSALAANLVQVQINRGRFAETVVAEEKPARRAA